MFRYRNGELITNSHLKHAKFPSLKFLSIEPYDEGIYQCLARNEIGEASMTFYLHVSPRTMLNNPPLKPTCHSLNDNNLNVTFDARNSEKFSSISFIAAYDDFESDTGFSGDLKDRKNFIINRSILRSSKLLKPFHLYLRTMLPSGKFITMSPLSEPIICAFQQIEPKFIKASNGSFLGWNVDIADEDLSKTVITIQFLKNDSYEPLTFANEVVGSYEKIDHLKTWNDVEKSLQKFPANSSDHGNFTEVKVPGNVTGILIIKVEEIFVRIFGSIEENGTHIVQDFSNIEWKSLKVLKRPIETINVTDIQARSVTVNWDGLDLYKCLRACTYLKQDILPNFLREKSTLKLNCNKM